MKVIGFIAICILLVVVSMPTNSDIDTDGKLTAHATAKKSNADKRLRCLTKSMCDDKWIENGWWGMTIQIDDTTWDRPTDGDGIDETPQYSGKLYKRMYKRERTHNDSGYSWAYLFRCQNPAALARGCRHRSCIVSRKSLYFVQEMWYPISIIRIGKQSPTLCRCPIHSIA